MIWACTETSSAVVGSSATISWGSAARASAITTRWRMPPENWWGKWSMRCSGAGMPVSPNKRMARWRASLRESGKWVVMVSTSCRPIEYSGLSEVSGS